MSPAEKIKFTKKDLPNISLLTRGNIPGEVKLTFVHTSMGKLLIWVPILYLTILGNPKYLVVCAINTNVDFSNEVVSIRTPSTDAILKWEAETKLHNICQMQEYTP